MSSSHPTFRSSLFPTSFWKHREENIRREIHKKNPSKPCFSWWRLSQANLKPFFGYGLLEPRRGMVASTRRSKYGIYLGRGVWKQVPSSLEPGGFRWVEGSDQSEVFFFSEFSQTYKLVDIHTYSYSYTIYSLYIHLYMMFEL